ncbi:peroxiredoxin-like family protein [uncultured Nonlabens sp.]|uniref:peroxiredoxin-like family protein n=1 Tax=uncultured Nonlabens sp. TaxID=859306 RepID=UPI002622B277|nr:peroxiredoxin-like family protein [uncultured Nonlabens sp.]
MNLIAQLQSLADDSASRHPGESQEIMSNGIKELKASHIASKSLKTGDKIPAIQLPNQNNELVDVQEILKTNKVVLSFYRGGWCPYCNLELKALQHFLPEIEEKGARLIAISPETPDNSMTTHEKNELTYDILTDKNNELARVMNLVFKLPKDLQGLYKKFGIDLERTQENTSQELPLAATYVIGKNGIIEYHFIEEDYKLRADPKEILDTI